MVGGRYYGVPQPAGRLRVQVLMLALAGAACAPRPKDTAARQTDRAAAQTDTPAAAAPAQPQPSYPVMRAQPEPQGPSALGLVGTWDIAPPSGMRGPSLSIVIDSARGPVFYGRLTRALSGDVELMEKSFRPFEGVIGLDGIARANVEAVEAGAPVTRIAGRVTAEGWTGTSLVWGGSELVTHDRTWKAVKSR